MREQEISKRGQHAKRKFFGLSGGSGKQAAH